MGSAASTSESYQRSNSLLSCFPLYYDPDQITAEDMKLVSHSLTLISNRNQLTHSAERLYLSSSTIDYFWKLFFNRLREQKKSAMRIFENNDGHSINFLLALLEMAWSQCLDHEKFKKGVTDFAGVHCRVGVPAEDYHAVGEALFWTLFNTLGGKIYDWRLERAWVKLYSSILTILIPIVLKLDKYLIISKSSKPLLDEEIMMI